LQSIDQPELCFIVLPIGPRNELIDYADIESACRQIGIGAVELVVLLLVTVRKGEQAVELTANLRAPLLIDAASFRGAQHVLNNERYPIRFPLSGD
jgi:flagellar assembly factor FliW